MKPDWLTRKLLCPKPRRAHDWDLRSQYHFHAMIPLLSAPFLSDAFDLVTLGARRSGSRITRVSTGKNATVRVSTHWLGTFEPWQDYEEKWLAAQSDEPFLSMREVRRRWIAAKTGRDLLAEVWALMQSPAQADNLADGCTYMAVVRRNGLVRTGSFPTRYGDALDDLLARIDVGSEAQNADWEA